MTGMARVTAWTEGGKPSEVVLDDDKGSNKGHPAPGDVYMTKSHGLVRIVSCDQDGKGFEVESLGKTNAGDAQNEVVL